MSTTRISSLAVMVSVVFALTATCSDDGGPDPDASLTEVCLDGVDNDGDGLADCEDPDCDSEPLCLNCGNGVAEGQEECDGTDLRGITDCADLPEGGYAGGALRCGPSCLYNEHDCVPEVTCDDITLTVTEEPEASWEHVAGENDSWFSVTHLSLDDDYEYLMYVEAWGHASDDPITTGVHQLGVGADGNYATCVYCVLMTRCLTADCEDYIDFFAISGTMTLDTIDATDGGSFRGTLEDLNLVQVEVDWLGDFTSTPVAGGECYDLESPYTFDATLTAY